MIFENLLAWGAPLAASLASAALAVIVLRQRPRGPLQWTFGLALLGFAAEALAILMVQQRTENAVEQTFWVQVVHGLGFPVLAISGLFVFASLSSQQRLPSWQWPFAAALASGLSVTGLLGPVLGPRFQPSEISGRYAARITTAGQYEVIVQLLATLGILGGLEACLRRSSRDTRWRSKYLLLGLGGIFLVRFYFLSNMLLFHVLPAVYLVTEVATLFVGILMVAISIFRDGLLGIDMTISRQIMYRSVVVVVAGGYLLVVGALGWVLNLLGVSDQLFWGSLVVFVSALALAALCLSDDVRWRVKRALGRHFYRTKYDYREQWTSFTKRLGSRLTLQELAPQLLATVTDAIGAAKGLLYLADGRDGHYHLTRSLGVHRAPVSLDPDSPLIALVKRGQVTLLPSTGPPGSEGLAPFADAVVAVPLSWQGTLAGLMLLGPERTGTPYSSADLELLATVGEQAAGAIVNTRLSETLATVREFEAFHRLTSFVVHDLKNAVSALSLLSRNALEYFDDPEFQRDAIRTLQKTTGRINRLLGKLTSAPQIDHFNFVEVDLSTLVLEAAAPLLVDKRVTQVHQIQLVPPILADREALERVLQNLITNALEAMAGVGEITLRTERHADLVSCSISDTGCGMSEEFLRKSLFVPFRSTKAGGWGIGLYHSHEIVKSHHGRIEVESVKGKGTSFTLLFPPAASTAARHRL